MQLVCQKYGETTNPDAAFCRHSQEYCKFRTSCIIQFEERQRRLAEKGEGDEYSGNQGFREFVSGK